GLRHRRGDHLVSEFSLQRQGALASNTLHRPCERSPRKGIHSMVSSYAAACGSALSAKRQSCSGVRRSRCAVEEVGGNGTGEGATAQEVVVIAEANPEADACSKPPLY